MGISNDFKIGYGQAKSSIGTYILPVAFIKQVAVTHTSQEAQLNNTNCITCLITSLSLTTVSYKQIWTNSYTNGTCGNTFWFLAVGY